MKINYGIISTAAITKRFIGAVRLCGGTVAGAASRSQKRAEEFCRQNSIPKAYGSYEELYNDDEIDIVYIATINAEHAKEIKEALNHGKHVLCEKPLALTEKDAAEIFELGAKKKRFIMEMQKSIFLPVTQLVKEYINSEELGKLHQIDMSACFPNPNASWMHDKEQGGVVYGSASYTLEYLAYLLQSTDMRIQALGTREKNGAVDAVSINVQIGQVLANSRITMKAQADSMAVFYFEKGTVRVDDYWKASSCEINTNGNISKKEFHEDYEMKYEVMHVHECLQKGLIQSPIIGENITVFCCKAVEQIMLEV